MLDIKSDLNNVVVDFLMTMDSVIPDGVNPSLYKHLKYSNRQQSIKFIKQHPRYNKDLLMKVAVHEFLKLSDEEKCDKLDKYMEGYIR